MHRPGNVRENPNSAFDLRDIAGGNLHCILQCITNDLRYIRFGHRVGTHQLVWEYTSLADGRRIAQSQGDQFRHTLLLENTMTSESVQVHPRGLPRRQPGNFDPLSSSEFQCCQHLERDIGSLAPLAFLRCFKSLELVDDSRQKPFIVIAPDEVTIERGASCGLRPRMDHLDDIRQRRALAYRISEYLFLCT